jgi:nicotinate dehydrogenase subunit A
MPGAIDLTVNGKGHSLSGDADRPLIDALRHDLGLTATRFGCGEGLCGACHVLVDGRAVTACNTPLWSAAGRTVVTLEGLGDAADPHPLQLAFIDEQAMQCGYCISGIIISAAALLAINPSPTDHEIRAALDGNLCRCGSHNRILRAIHRAAAAMRGQAAHV